MIFFGLRCFLAFVFHEAKTLFGSINDGFITCFKPCFTFDNTAMYMWNELVRLSSHRFFLGDDFCGLAVAWSQGCQIKESGLVRIHVYI